tara:strand:+ start:197 stop:901 length:705 start_codon:yes stop_codon:yes gene_type:complete
MCAKCGEKEFSDKPQTSVGKKFTPAQGSQGSNTPPITKRSSLGNAKIIPKGWLESPPTPWRRYAARMLDLSFFGSIAFLLIAMAYYSVAPYSADQFFGMFEHPSAIIIDIMLTVFLGSLLTGAVIGITGFSLGKFIFGIIVTDSTGSKIGVFEGIQRDLKVFIRGLGLGIPIVNLFTLYAAHKRLSNNNVTSWDEEKQFRVFHRPSGIGQYLLNVIGITILALINVLMQLLNTL